MKENETVYRSGLIVPMIGLGTFNLRGDVASATIIKAYENGYRLFDTATNYLNQTDIAKSIRILPREHLRITSKLSKMDIEKNGVKKSCDIILSELGTGYLDILFLHHPKVGFLPEIMESMIKLKESGLIRSIGVSNFSRVHLLEIKEFLSFVDVNQIEAHPLLDQPSLYAFCNMYHIQLMAYRPFANGKLGDKKILQDLSDKYKKSWYQIVLRWLIQNNMQAIPKAGSEKHLQENFDIFNFELLDEETKLIDTLNENMHTCISKFIDYSDLNYD